MKPFVDSSSLLDDAPKLRRRLRNDGYLFLRNVLPRSEVMDLRLQILEICERAGWLRPGVSPIDGLTDRPPITDKDDEHVPVYAQVQSLEAFHRLKFNDAIMGVAEGLFQESVFPFPQSIARIAFPRDNARGTPAHQDWIFVGGSTETISCWLPLGDVPPEVGGLKILAGSHKAGFLEPRPAPGTGGRIVDVDQRLTWHQSGYKCGDVLLFKMLTVHAAAANLTPDVLRLSADFRYSGTSHVINEKWFQPHFDKRGERYTWEVLEMEWRDKPDCPLLGTVSGPEDHDRRVVLGGGIAYMSADAGPMRAGGRMPRPHT